MSYIPCRENCGACCIAISISSPLPGMPDGKPAGVRCDHLTDDMKCGIFDSPNRPEICGNFKAETIICGNSRDEAMSIISKLEGLQ